MIAEKIAVIDDDINVINRIKSSFKEYEVLAFSDSIKAVSYFKKPRDINLVLIDVMMPGIDGLHVLREIKKHNKEIMVVMMTGYGSMEVVVDALRGGAIDFIEKPFNVAILKDKVFGMLKNRMPFHKESIEKYYKVDRIKSFMKRNYSEISLKLVADEMCLSPKHISRMFKEKSGTTFRDHKIKVKMDIAKSLLKDTGFSVNEISDRLGYKSPETFMRIFKQKNNVTPSQYRKEATKNRLLPES